MPVFVSRMTTEVVERPVPLERGGRPEEEPRTAWAERDRVRALTAGLERDRARLSGETHE